jgi:transmembrane sensor
MKTLSVGFGLAYGIVAGIFRGNSILLLPTDMTNSSVPQIAGFLWRNKPGVRLAAIFIIAISIGIFFLLRNPVRPGRCRAVLFSVGGTPRVIDDYKKGVLYIIHNDNLAAKDKYITLYTPRGADFNVRFPDGTTVWLNAQSKIRYPANFSQDTILLTVNGESYIECSHNLNSRLQISVGSVKIKPFGAHLDIKNYPDDQAVITLLAGNAIIRLDQKYPGMDNSELKLHPYEQAKLAGLSLGERIKLLINPLSDNVNDVIAWKNGNTSFRKADIQCIMHAVSRWYNVDIIYEGDIPDNTYNISLPRSTPLEQLLNALTKQGGNFNLKGKTVNVMK